MFFDVEWSNVSLQSALEKRKERESSELTQDIQGQCSLMSLLFNDSSGIIVFDLFYFYNLSLS